TGREARPPRAGVPAAAVAGAGGQNPSLKAHSFGPQGEIRKATSRTGRSRGSLLGEHFLGHEARENVPKAPAGLPEEQQPDAALERAGGGVTLTPCLGAEGTCLLRANAVEVVR